MWVAAYFLTQQVCDAGSNTDMFIDSIYLDFKYTNPTC
jgi:hypothetical protein